MNTSLELKIKARRINAAAFDNAMNRVEKLHDRGIANEKIQKRLAHWTWLIIAGTYEIA